MTPQERKEMVEAVAASIIHMTGPMGDLTRAMMAAKVDGLIDARQRMVQAGWPEWMVHAAMMAFITGEAGNLIVNEGQPGLEGPSEEPG